MRTYDVKIRISGRVSIVQVQARDALHANMLVRAQYGDAVEILYTKVA